MKWLIIAAAIAGAVAALDRLALWAESRGWLFYRHRKASGASVSNAMLEMQALFQPDKHHVVVERRQRKVDAFEIGDPPDADEADAGEADAGEG